MSQHSWQLCVVCHVFCAQHLGALHEQQAAVVAAAQLQIPDASAVFAQQPRLRDTPLQ
jgi:hypothetical protein